MGIRSKGGGNSAYRTLVIGLNSHAVYIKDCNLSKARMTRQCTDIKRAASNRKGCCVSPICLQLQKRLTKVRPMIEFRILEA